jgi:hypothetical protein
VFTIGGRACGAAQFYRDAIYPEGLTMKDAIGYLRVTMTAARLPLAAKRFQANPCHFNFRQVGLGIRGHFRRVSASPLCAPCGHRRVRRSVTAGVNAQAEPGDPAGDPELAVERARCAVYPSLLPLLRLLPRRSRSEIALCFAAKAWSEVECPGELSNLRL